MSERESMIDRFVKYTKIETTADPESKTTPSTPGQMELAKIIRDDLAAANVTDLEMTEEGFIYATIEENLPADHPAKGKVPIIGLLSHLDTATEASGKNVNAQFIKNYQGASITFPGNPNLKLTTDDFPKLKECIGHTIITSDGTTLLGSDDKAGLSIIVELAHYFNDHPEELHGKLRLAIIPDEEIAVGAEKLDLKRYGADVAYTLDGGELGEIDVESFNGFKGTIEVEGYSAFPGYGKGIYVNAIQVLSKFIAAMSEELWPQNCDERQPIWWIHNCEAEVAKATAAIFLRGFDLKEIEKQKVLLGAIKDKLLRDYPKAKINLDITEMYKNYKCELDKDPRVVEYAEEAMKRIDIEPKRNFVRGGNDSCHLCFNGLLSTNLFVGMQNMHSFMEWTSVEWIQKSMETAVSLAKVWVDKSAE
jgi:tripeptide aminopeptidase